MHAVIRRYENASRLIQELQRKPQEVERLLATVPGFVAYHGLVSGDTFISVSVCRDKAGTDETTRRAATWVKENVPAGSIPAPQITDGETFLDFGTPQTLGAPGMQQRV